MSLNGGLHHETVEDLRSLVGVDVDEVVRVAEPSAELRLTRTRTAGDQEKGHARDRRLGLRFAGAVRCHASNRGDIDGLGAWVGRQSIPNTEDHFTSRYRSAFGAVAPALVRPTGTATLDRATSEWRRADRRALRPGMITNSALVSVYRLDQDTARPACRSAVRRRHSRHDPGPHRRAA